MTINTRRSLASVFLEADKTETNDGKVAVLRHNESDTLKVLLRLANDHKAKWLLPLGAPPYRPADAAADLQGRLYNEIRKFYLFVEGGNPPPPQLANTKREQLFIQLLETVDPDDAKLIVAVKDRNLTEVFPSLTVDIINEAFPGLVDAPKKTVKSKNKKEDNE